MQKMEILEHIKRKFADKFLDAHISDHDGNIVISTDIANLYDLLLYLEASEKTNFASLMSICGVDDLNSSQRFTIIYALLSLKFNVRARIKVSLTEREQVPSITSIYSAAGWYEREVFDMYGVKFSDSPDLRRILTDYDFSGHPLRKDFPLTGFVETRYDMAQQKVVYEPVKLDQEFRDFDFLSPWSGEADYDLEDKK